MSSMAMESPQAIPYDKILSYTEELVDLLTTSKVVVDYPTKDAISELHVDVSARHRSYVLSDIPKVMHLCSSRRGELSINPGIHGTDQDVDRFKKLLHSLVEYIE